MCLQQQKQHLDLDVRKALKCFKQHTAPLQHSLYSQGKSKLCHNMRINTNPRLFLASYHNINITVKDLSALSYGLRKLWGLELKKNIKISPWMMPKIHTQIWPAQVNFFANFCQMANRTMNDTLTEALRVNKCLLRSSWKDRSSYSVTVWST